jgi:D-serine deaminase-like pyridoxal phosphate-dependent protein
MQAQIGSCRKEDIAVVLLCPVVSVQPGANKVVVYGGGIHFSKDFILDESGERVYGELVALRGDSWATFEEPFYMRRLSQEHGVLELTSPLIETIKPGDILGFLPVHSCMTAQCMGGYLCSEGEELDHFGRVS